MKTDFGRQYWNRTLFCIICILWSVPAFPQSVQTPENEGISARIDWPGKKVVIEIREKVPKNGKNLAAATYTVERSIQAHLEASFFAALSDFPVSSRDRLAALARRDPGLAESFRTFARTAVKTSSRRTEDFSLFSVTYTVPLYPELSRLLVRHSRPYSPPRLLDYVSTAGYTGIVLYAKGDFPVHGEQGTSKLEPCLFPRIYDSRMNLLLEPGMVDPSILVATGMAAYTARDDADTIGSAAGANPLYIVVEKVFGTRRSDIVIPNTDAAKILSSEANRKLLTSGKILVICDLP